ncbi:MAG: hypothetical protein ACI9C4_000962 [Paraglaciecola sp.]|jgi:hypothetical protein
MTKEDEPQKSFEQKSLRGAPQRSGGGVSPETMKKVEPQLNADLAERMFVRGQPILGGACSELEEKETLKLREQIPVQATPKQRGGATEPD